MANKFLDIIVDTKKITRLQNKMEKYPPYAIKAGMEAVSNYLNDSVLEQMYPPESDAPFQWSSDKQRRAYFASDGFGAGIPYSRTYDLMTQSEFYIEPGSFQGTPYSSIGFRSQVPYAKYVIGPDAIIGHIKRGWKPVNQFVVTKSKDIARVFQQAVKDTWDKMESFMFGGGGGL